MNRLVAIAGLLAASLAHPSGIAAESLRYWGAQGGTATGWVELGHKTFREVAPGMEIPGWGRVKEIGEDRIVVERPLTEAEKTDLEERGAATYDALEIHIPREDLRVQPPPQVPPRTQR